MKKKKRVQPFDYLKNHVKFYLKRSNTHGVGLFALVDIKEGEELYVSYGKQYWYDNCPFSGKSRNQIIKENLK